MEPRLETTTLLLFLPNSPPKPQIKTSTAALGYSQAGTPSPGLLRSATLPPGPARSASLFQHAARSGARALPGGRAHSSRGSGWRLGILTPSPLNPSRPDNNSPCLLSSPSCQPIAKAEPTSPREATGGCCPNAARRRTGGGGCGRSWGPACEKPQPSP